MPHLIIAVEDLQARTALGYGTTSFRSGQACAALQYALASLRPGQSQRSDLAPARSERSPPLRLANPQAGVPVLPLTTLQLLLIPCAVLALACMGLACAPTDAVASPLTFLFAPLRRG